MKPLHFMLAAYALSGAPLLAAPTDTPPVKPANSPKTPAMAPAAPAPAAPAPAAPAPAAPAAVPIDARAVALFDQSIAAYAALPSLSQKFEIVDKIGGLVQPGSSGTGTLQIQRPGKARLQLKMGDREMVYVSDGATLIAQTEPASYQQQPMTTDTIGRVVAAMPSAANLPLGTLLSGENPLSSDVGMKWEKVMLSPLDGLDGVTMQTPPRGAQGAVTFQVYLDAKTHLIARVEAGMAVANKAGETPKIYSNVTRFAPDESAITGATFQYVPPVGAKLLVQAERPKSYDERLIVGAKPFALTGKTLEGKTLSLDSYKGKVVLLDFWATWCGPCIGELPNVVSNYKTYHPQGFDIVAVSLDEEESNLRDFVKAKELPWPQIFDGKGWEAGDAQTYGVRAIPFTLLIGKDGTIAAVNPRGAELEPAIKAALAK